MQKSLCLLIGIILFSIKVAFSQSDIKVEYLGKKFKDYYEMKDLTKISSAAVNLHYGVAHLKKDNADWLFLSTYTNSETRPDDFDLKVIDIIALSEIEENTQKLMLKNCQLKGKDDPTIFAQVTMEDKKYLTKILKVWKVDKPNGKIITFSSSGVRCLNNSVKLVNKL
jgi:hypothetical protein